jgi:hypothetical protein
MWRIEATLHRFGGPEGYRDWGPSHLILDESNPTWAEITAKENQAYFMQLQFSDPVPTGEDWLAFTVVLNHPNGQRVGVRPALLYNKPYDVATYTSFKNEWDGLYSLGLRIIERS